MRPQMPAANPCPLPMVGYYGRALLDSPQGVTNRDRSCLACRSMLRCQVLTAFNMRRHVVSRMSPRTLILGKIDMPTPPVKCEECGSHKLSVGKSDGGYVDPPLRRGPLAVAGRPDCMVTPGLDWLVQAATIFPGDAHLGLLTTAHMSSSSESARGWFAFQSYQHSLGSSSVPSGQCRYFSQAWQSCSLTISKISGQ